MKSPRFWLIVGVAALLLFLQWQFPYAARGSEQQVRIVYLLLWLGIIGGGMVTYRRSAKDALSHIVIWIGIFGVLIVGYSYRDLFSNSRFMAELMPGRAQQHMDGTFSVQTSEDGHFHIEGDLNGATISFIIDTGASDIVLSPDDARAAGFDVETLGYSRSYRTANGVVRGAPVKVASLAIGPVELHDVPASVNQAGMDESLLGMAFLKRLKSYHVDGDTLTLTP